MRFSDNFRLSDLESGFRACIPVAIGAATYGAVLGVLAAAKQISLGDMSWMSLLVFAGSSQFVAVELWQTDALPIVTIVMATLAINLRYLLMCAALHKIFHGSPLSHKMIGIHLISDENWAVTLAHKGHTTPGFLLGGGLSMLSFWTLGVSLGHSLGAVLPAPETLGLDFAFTAAFIVLLLSMYQSRADILPWVVSALVALAVANLVPGKWYIVVGALAGAITAALTWRAQLEAPEDSTSQTLDLAPCEESSK